MRSVAFLMILAAGCGDPPAAVDAGSDGAVAPDAGRELFPERYPVDATEHTPETCAAARGAHWVASVPVSCESGRLCLDDRGRTYREGAPFIVRGVYHGGREVEALLSNCPVGGACEATQPADHAAYLETLADAGINVMLEAREALSDPMRAALDAQSRVGLAHLLFGDPFEESSHDALVASIEAAAPAESTWLWFGPDEPDLNRTWPMAAGIKRLLRGASPELDALLERATYRPASATPFLPPAEPAHDPNALPYAAAVVIDDAGLAIATDLFDLRVPVTYPFQEPYSRADDSIWTIERISRFDEPDSPTMPVLQMVELEGLNLVRPSPGQIRAQILGAVVHGAAGAYYFKVAGDDPPFADRAGWFAADDVEGWAAYTAMHALWDSLVPVLYGEARVERGAHDILHWRRFALGDRRVLLIVNPTPYRRWVDLDAILARAPAERVRHWSDCAPLSTRAREIAPYETLALEVFPVAEAVEGDPGDPLAGTTPERPPLPPAAPLGTSWTTEAPLAAGRSAHVAIGGDALRLLGGYTGSLTASSSAEAWGGAALPDLLLGTASAAGFETASGDLVIAGGVPRFATDAPVEPWADCQRFDGAAWSPCAPLGNGPTSAAASVAWRDELYLFGGLVDLDPTEGNTVTQVVQRYDADADAWEAETHLPVLRVQGAAMAHDGVVYLVGGFGASGLAADVLAYDLPTHAWIDAAVAPLPTPRAGLACVAHAGFGYSVGGFDAAGDNLRTAERLDFASGEWTALDPLPEAVSDTTATIVGDALHVAGGLNASFADSPAVWSLR